MDKETLKEIAKNEVASSHQPDFNPLTRGLTSLFANNMRPRFDNLEYALEFYNELSDEEVERRYCIHYWEECALGAYISICRETIGFLSKSIDCRELARRELHNLELFLSTGVFNSLLDKEYFLLDQIPELYEQLLIGEIPNFFDTEEIEAYQNAQDEKTSGSNEVMQFVMESTGRIRDKKFYEEFKAILKASEDAAPKFIDFFNKDWLASMQAQALVWLKEYLYKVIKEGTPYISDSDEFSKYKAEQDRIRNRRQQIPIKKLRRSNDGYQAMTKSYQEFLTKNERNPEWYELMDFMSKNPPSGFFVESKLIKNKVDFLIIEGSEKPIDRDAFKKRFERYFPKKRH